MGILKHVFLSLFFDFMFLYLALFLIDLCSALAVVGLERPAVHRFFEIRHFQDHTKRSTVHGRWEVRT